MSISLVTVLWNGDKYGFPYREMISEMLELCDDAVVVLPETDEEDACEDWIMDTGPAVKVGGFARIAVPADISAAVNKGIAMAGGDFIIHVQCDEFLEVTDVLRRDIAELTPRLLTEPIALAFPRMDFTESAEYVTPIFEGEPTVTRLFARKWFPQISSLDDAMHIGPALSLVLAECPIWHYHGLTSEKAWQEKETKFQELYVEGKVFDAVDPRIAKGAEVAWTDPRSRRYKLGRPHPKRMQPWLEKSWMTGGDTCGQS